ncbi:HDOD domain-containing protein [Andreprevotia lacus]|nr:HDOD domain-containing protein [Andreprevotia lacus]
MKSLVIPPRPAILVALEEAARAAEPDLAAIGRIIVGDLALSAAVLKTVNSPLFRRGGKIGSVPQAVQMLGRDNLYNVVRGLLLRHSIKGKGLAPEQLDSFWSIAQQCAMVAAYLAARVPGVQPDDAYTYGLFRHCGMILMAMRFPSYAKNMHESERLARAEGIAQEEKRYHTSFNVIGYLVCRSWYLPEDVALAVLNQHDYALFDGPGRDQHHILALVALGSLAEHIVKMTVHQFEHVEWRQIEPTLLRFLGLDGNEFEDLYDAMQGMLAEH